MPSMAALHPYRLLSLAGLIALATDGGALAATDQATVTTPYVDLGIGDESTGRPNLRADNALYNRPAILIAWRNTAQVLEVEVLVRNLGNDQGQGKVHMEILDEYGTSLVRMPEPGKEPIVNVPARTEGGREGKIVQLAGTRSLNALIDRLDRDRVKYYIKAAVETIGEDRNLLDNVKVKSYNRDFKARPGALHTFDYYFTNPSDEPQQLQWHLDVSPLPKGWQLQARPAPGQKILLGPNQTIQGVVLIRAPREIIEGDRMEVRFSAVDEGGNVAAQTEWHLVNDNKSPDIISPSISLNDDNGIDIELTADDPMSGIYEASGVKAEYSTDGGSTYSTRVISYLFGNFVGPTLFQTTLGPFAANTQVLVTLSAMDIAGNIARTEPVTVQTNSEARMKAAAR